MSAPAQRDEVIQLSRGTAVMSRASVAAIDPALLRQVIGESELLIAEDVIATLDATGER